MKRSAPLADVVELTYYTPREFALISRYAVSYLSKLRHRDDGPPYVKPRGKVLYPQAAALAWLAGQNGTAS